MKTQTLIHTSFARTFSETRTLSSTVNRTFSKTRAGIACALVFMLAVCAACFTSLVSTPQAYADETPGTTKTVTATQKITATFSADGTITVPDTQVQNGLDYTITIDDVSIESEYSFVSDWFFDGMEEEITIAPGKSMLMSWNAPSKVPASFEAEEEVHVGTIIYTYSYTVPALTGSIEIEGTPEVGQTLTAQVSDLPSTISESDLAYAWYVVADDGALTPIEGATSKTYEVAEQYAGKKLTCVATDTTGYYKGTLQAEPVTIKSPLTGSVSITQDGVVVEEAEAETELVATLSDEVPEDANPTYAWYVSEDGENFTLIEGAMDASFTPDASYVDKYIKVEVASELYSGVLTSTNKVKITPVKIAFVVLSGDDTAGYDMYFCKRETVPAANDTIKIDDTTGEVSAALVYTGVEDTSESVPWASKLRYVKNVTIADDNIQPVSTAVWFNAPEEGGSIPSTPVTKFVGLSKLDTSNVTDMQGMFCQCAYLESIDLTGWDTSNVTDMSYLFFNCWSLREINVNSLDTSSVKDMSFMFYNALGASYSPTSLDLSNWSTVNVENMQEMFDYCQFIQELKVTVDETHWNTSKVTNMAWMFADASSLTLDCSNWNVSSIVDYGGFNSGASKVTAPNWPTP